MPSSSRGPRSRRDRGRPGPSALPVAAASSGARGPPTTHRRAPWSCSSTASASTAGATTTSRRGSSARATPCTRSTIAATAAPTAPAPSSRTWTTPSPTSTRSSTGRWRPSPACRCSCSATAWAALIALRYALAHQDRLAGLILSAALAELDAVPKPLRARRTGAVGDRAARAADRHRLRAGQPRSRRRARPTAQIRSCTTARCPHAPPPSLPTTVERFPETVAARSPCRR